MRRLRAPIVWYSSRQSNESPMRVQSRLKACSSSRVTRSQAAMKFGRETLRGGPSLEAFADASSSTSSGS